MTLWVFAPTPATAAGGGEVWFSLAKLRVCEGGEDGMSKREKVDTLTKLCDVAPEMLLQCHTSQPAALRPTKQAKV